MKNYIALLNEAVPGITAEDMNLPFDETGIHSLDSIILRATIEGHFGFEIPDSDWYGFKSLSETLAWCNGKKSQSALEFSEGKITLKRDQEIKIPQMANSALSENWLLKEMGDMHWEMLSHGLEQKPSEFTDNNGNRLYAAFVRVNYNMAPLDSFKENKMLHLASKIKRFGNYAYYSVIDGKSGNNSLKANMMTSFSARKANDNSQISKSNPDEKTNHIEELESTPGFYNEHRSVKKGMTTEIVSHGHKFNITDSVIDSLKHTINPYYEINGVGLLYFAAFPIIADECTSSFLKTTMGMVDYDATYHTTFRDIFYFANCNANDRVTVNLNSIEHIEGNKLKITTSLYRESDNKLMARVMTVKEKTV